MIRRRWRDTKQMVVLPVYLVPVRIAWDLDGDVGHPSPLGDDRRGDPAGQLGHMALDLHQVVEVAHERLLTAATLGDAKLTGDGRHVPAHGEELEVGADGEPNRGRQHPVVGASQLSDRLDAPSRRRLVP